MARGNYQDYIAGRPEVRLKKYLYALRPLLCIRWMEHRGTPPPTSALETLEGAGVEAEIRNRIVALMARKQQAGEVGIGAPDLVLSAFIEDEIARIAQQVASLPDERMEAAPLDALAWEVLGIGKQ